MTRALIAALVVLSLLSPALAAAEPCSPEPGKTPPGAKACDERGLPGVALAPGALGVPSPPSGAVSGAPTTPLGEDGPSLLGALARLLGAVILIALLMAASVLGYRRLVQRMGGIGGGPPKFGARSGVLAWATGWTDESSADAVRVTSRRYLGGRESVALVHAGGERFLVGITAGQVSLLARLESPAAEAVPDFTEALARATDYVGDPRRVPQAPTLRARSESGPSASAPTAPSATEQLRAAVERSRERLGRLAHLSVVPRDPRG